MTRIDREELRRPQRKPTVKRARELFMYLGRRHTGASLREMADRLGVRDISTVSHGEAGHQKFAGKQCRVERVEANS